jgi:hypothetical protein
MSSLAEINEKARALLREGLEPGEFALYLQQFGCAVPIPAAKRPARSAVSFDEIRTRIAALRSGGRLRDTPQKEFTRAAGRTDGLASSEKCKGLLPP